MKNWNHFQNKQIDEIKKHLETLNDEQGEIEKSISAIKKDIWWLKRILFIGFGIMSSLLVTIIGLLLK